MTFSIVFVVISLVSYAYGAVLSNVFNSHMVLVSFPSQATLFGWVTPAATITITFDGAVLSPTPAANSEGFWNFQLPATAASYSPHAITASSSDGNSQTLSDVLFGIVHLCSGQSNMCYAVAGEFNETSEIALAENYPYIRRAIVPDRYDWEAHHNEINVSVDWDNYVGWFSAVCWHYGLFLHQKLNVPVGLVQSCWGGTYIETWSSKDALNQCTCHVGNDTNNIPNYNSALWNSMIYPLRNMKFSSVIWYQGENNVWFPDCYSCLLPAMVSDWRSKFGGQKLPFFTVQLAPWTGTWGSSLPIFRLQQEETISKMADSGIATAADLGDIDAPWGDIHPRNKRTVGERLGQVAASYFGLTNVQSEGPKVEWAIITSLAPSSVVYVKFTAKSIGSGLVLRTPIECPPNAKCGISFELGTEDDTWFEANSMVYKEAMIKLSATISTGINITKIRYAYAEWPKMTLFNKDGLPAFPFFKKDLQFGVLPTDPVTSGSNEKHGNNDNNSQQSGSFHHFISSCILLITSFNIIF